MLLHQMANPADHKQKPGGGINMRVMTSQCQTSGKNHMVWAVKTTRKRKKN